MKQSAKRLISIFLSLFFLAAAFVMFFDLVQPAYGEVQTLRGQLAGESQSLASEQTLVSQAKNLINSYNNGSSMQNNVSLAIPQGADIAGALAQIEGIAQNNGILITSISIGAPTLAPSTSGNTPTPQAIKPLGSFSLSFAGSGSYENFKNFLSQLETNIRIFDLESLFLSPVIITNVNLGKNATTLSGATHDFFNFNISMQTYYQLP